MICFYSSLAANTDYVPGPFEVEFLPGTTHVTQPISIVDDNILENIGDNNVYNGLEHFLCRMDITEDLLQKGVMVETTEARVNITDNDGMNVGTGHSVLYVPYIEIYSNYAIQHKVQ